MCLTCIYCVAVAQEIVRLAQVYFVVDIGL